jgi:hypothetical protein
VRISSAIETPSSGWGNINGSSVGTIKTLSEDPQSDKTKVVVEFEEEKEWRGLLRDLERFKGP